MSSPGPASPAVAARPATGAPAAVAGPAQLTSQVTARCRGANTEAWVGLGNRGGYSAGVRLPLEFSNLGKHACSLAGYPRVAATSANGRQIGQAASRRPGTHPHLVVLRPGQTAHAVLQIVAASHACKLPTSARALRISPPGQGSQTIGLIVAVCAHRPTLSVTPIEPGTGVP